MSIFSRLFRIGQAKANQVVNDMEKPELMLDQAIREKDEQIRDAKKSVQACIATERQAKALLEREREEKVNWEKRAEVALRSGKEELALKALARATEYEKKSSSLQTSWEGQRTQVDGLKQEIHKLEEELAEYKRNKDFIIAQSKAAEVKKSIYEAKAKMSSKNNGADDLMARMKAKSERTAHEADAAREMADSFSGQDRLEKEFESLDDVTASREVQDKLAALKNRISQ